MESFKVLMKPLRIGKEHKEVSEKPFNPLSETPAYL
jgi:hypothetical protein